MKKRLVLAACRDTHRTNWMRATGDENAVWVSGLGDGDVVELVLVRESGDLCAIALNLGSQPMPEGKWVRYMVSKVACDSISQATTVEIFMNGSSDEAYRSAGNAVDP